MIFKNELGNEILVEINKTYMDDGREIRVVGPNSEMTMELTPMELEVVYQCLKEFLRAHETK